MTSYVDQFEKGELDKCCPILVEGIVRVSTFHKFKSNQSNVFQCQLDNLLLLKLVSLLNLREDSLL